MIRAKPTDLQMLPPEQMSQWAWAQVANGLSLQIHTIYKTSNGRLSAAQHQFEVVPYLEGACNKHLGMP